MTMKETIDFSSLNEVFGLPPAKPVLVNWSECIEVFQEGLGGHHMPHTQEAKDAISRARKGIVFSEETRRKMSESAKKRGDNCSPEVRKRISEARGKTYTLNNPEGKDVTFTNLNRFCRENGLDNKCLSRVVRGERNTHKGWTRP